MFLNQCRCIVDVPRMCVPISLSVDSELKTADPDPPYSTSPRIDPSLPTVEMDSTYFDLDLLHIERINGCILNIYFQLCFL